MSSNQQELLTQAQAGDQRAFAELVNQSYNHLWAVCLRITGNHHDAEDALQNALTAAWQNLHKFNGTAKFSTWAHRIATNAALMLVRSRREVADDDDALQDVADLSPALDSVIATQSVVGQALEKLQPDFREAIVLREYGDLTYQQIAEFQGVPVQTVRSRINRARKKLREELVPLLA